ncbi:MAG: hypothetical protein V4513_00020 [Pseudomonadota bacterium]
MATNNRGGNRGGNRSNRGRNNNPEGNNQYTSGWMGSARENPLTAAAAVGGAVAAGVFLWSRRNQITDQLSNLSDQISEWREGYQSDGQFAGDNQTESESFMASSSPNRGRGRKSQADISAEALTLKETGKATA